MVRGSNERGKNGGKVEDKKEEWEGWGVGVVSSLLILKLFTYSVYKGWKRFYNNLY